jgi:hypothetical protein
MSRLRATFPNTAALRFHDVAKQAPFEVWPVIGHKDQAPQIDATSDGIVRFPAGH